jgi:hypothetical protein
VSRLDIARLRLRSQRLVGTPFAQPVNALRWFGAVQAQDYAGAKWGLAQRTAGATDAAIDALFDAGTILRTHVMRPTWHFVLPADIRWLLALTGPRVKAASAHYDRKLELDDAVFARSAALLREALHGGTHMTRAELADVLQRGGISARAQRLGHLLMRLELDAVITSGQRRGRQLTYALLDERAPPVPGLTRDEALAELTTRYFTSHGPATAQDFAWWAGLRVSDARLGLARVGSRLARAEHDGASWWFTATATGSTAETAEPVVHLLPNYDEHIVAYRDHGPSLAPGINEKLHQRRNALDAHIIVLNGRVIGGWRRTLQRKQAVLETTLLVELRKKERAALQRAAESYGRFLGLPAILK